jgi:glycosyltransferase involved in cell wall biosynthesis
MRIAVVLAGKVPCVGYGGTERQADWLANELARLGHEVTLVAPPGSSSPRCKLVFARSREEALAAVPPATDIAHFHAWYPLEGFRLPYLNTVHTLEKLNLGDGANWCHVSASHAALFGRTTFVHNGFPVDAYRLAERKGERLLFLAGIARSGKNLNRAVDLARKFDFGLDIAGGSRWRLLTRSQTRRELVFFKSLGSRFRFHGMVDGERKLGLLGEAKAFLNPIRWEEPFGMAPVEAMLCGTPVLATARGAMPEIITEEVGRLFETDDEFATALGKVAEIAPKHIREAAAERFSIARAANGYVSLYERILSGESLS